MASAYKRASKAAVDADSSDDSMDDMSSSTLRADSDEEDSASDESLDGQKQSQPTNKLTQVPVELRNRILMLTSRGVSFRYVRIFTVSCRL